MISIFKDILVSEQSSIPFGRKVSEEDIVISKFFYGKAAPSDKILFLCSDTNGPVCLIKILRDSAFNRKLKHERDGQLFGLREVGMMQVPKIYLEGEIGDFFFYVEEVINGGTVGKRRAHKHIPAVLAYQNEVPKGARLPAATLARLVRTLHVSDIEIRECSAVLESLPHITLHTARSHGDLTHMNLLESQDGDLYLIDWERWDERNIWGADLAHYLIRSSKKPDKKSYDEKIKRYVGNIEVWSALYYVDRIFDSLRKNYAPAYETLVRELKTL